MSSLTGYKGLQIVSPAPSGDGGLAIQNNFKDLADSNGPSTWDQTADPGVDDDVTAGYYPGSRWLNTTTGTIWTCVSNASGAAAWQAALSQNPEAANTVLAGPPSDSAVAVANSSFEVPDLGATNWSFNPAGATWSFTNNAGIQSNGSVWGAADAPDGTQTALLQGNGSLPSMSQSVMLAAGTYTATFMAARRSTQVQPIQLIVDGTNVGSAITPANSSFASYSTSTFTVTAGSHVIEFAGTVSGSDVTTFMDEIALAASSPTDQPPTFRALVVADLPVVDIAHGGTGATDASDARAALGLGTAAVLDTGASDGDIPVLGSGGLLPSSVCPVQSVNTQTGAVVLTTTDIAEGTNLYYTTARVETDAPNVTLDSTAEALLGLSGQELSLISEGANTVLAGPPAAAEVVPENNSFEVPDIGPATYEYRPSGSSWDFENNAGIVSNGGLGQPDAPNGNQVVFLQGNGVQGYIGQSIDLEAGTYYASFYAAQRSGQVQPIRFRVDGTAVGSDITPSGDSYAVYNTSTFTVSAGSHTVSFEATISDADVSSFLDEVVLVASSPIDTPPTFRLLVVADLPVVDIAHGGTGSTDADDARAALGLAGGADLFGDGSDGDVTLTSNTTLTRSMYYASLTVNSGVTLSPAGFRIHCSGTITNNGTISGPGIAGSTGGTGTGSAGGSGGSASSTASYDLAANTAGTAGGSGGFGGSSPGTSGGDAASGYIGGGAAGSGGAGGSGGGGSGGAAGAASSAVNTVRCLTVAPPLTAGAYIRGGAGGSGGGGGAGDSSSGGGGGGSGGGGGQHLFLLADTIANSGTISASGGAGGAGGNAYSSGNPGGGAGGGGGGGGVIQLAYNTLTAGTLTVAGGALGSGGTGTGTGSAGAGGTAGSAGVVLKYNLTTRAWE